MTALKMNIGDKTVSVVYSDESKASVEEISSESTISNQFQSQQVHTIRESVPEPSRSVKRVLELYSGIGGMRYALRSAGIKFEIVAAIDLNPYVNMIYQHNFGNIGDFQKNILSFSANHIEHMDLDIITLSPPCQPFTRVGLKKDMFDARNSSFLHFLDILSQLHKKPQYLLLENVQGFEKSYTRTKLIETLSCSKYKYQEFLLSPKDFGIPNSRLRYYLIAKCCNSDFSFPLSSNVLLEMPNTSSINKYACESCGNIKGVNCTVSHYLENEADEYFDPYLVPDAILLKYVNVMDIVQKNSAISCCFTRGYYSYIQGTGSLLVSSGCNLSKVFEDAKNCKLEYEKLSLLKQLKLRYFTPREIANLMCFPKDFCFPESIALKKMYRSLGNSLNIFVVSSLMKLLFD